MAGPTRQPAVLLRDLRGLTAYVECRGTRVAACGVAYRLCNVRDGAEERLLLIGDEPPPDAIVGGEVGTVEPDGDSLIFRRGLFRRNRTLTVQFTREAGTLLELLPLEAAPSPPGLTHVLFAPRDPAQAQDLVAACVSLGHDRIQFARAGANGAERLLLRVDHAPSYVVLRALEQPDGPAVYRRSSDRVWVAWGLHHPLEERWSAKTAAGATFLLGREGASRFDALTWTPLQDALEVVPDFPAAPVLTGLSPEGLRFRVPLRLEPRSERTAPTAWLLDPPQLPELERLFASLDGALLGALELAVLEDPERGRRYLVRERPGQESTHLDPGGQPFTPHRLVVDLLLPTNRDLRPFLPAPTYTRVLGLGAGHLVILEGSGDTFRSLAVPKSAFRPLETLVDHLVADGVQQLTALRARTGFELGAYADLPSRPPMPGGQGVPKGAEQGSPGRPPPERPKDGRPPEPGPRPPRPQRTPDAPEPPPEEAASFARRSDAALLAEEERLELELATEGPTGERWWSLLEVKRQLERWPDAVECAVELLWLDPAEGDRERARAGLSNALEGWVRSTAGLTGSGVQEARRAAALLAVERAARTSHPSGQVLAEAFRGLREVEGGLRFKTRWLGWEGLLAQNNDQQEAARVRTTIQAALAHNKLDQTQLPPFLFTRLSGLKGASEFERQPVRSQLARLDAWAHRLPPGLQSSATATTARALAAFGGAAQADQLLQRSLAGLGGAAPHQQAWTWLFAAATEAHLGLGVARDHRQAFEALLPGLRPDEVTLLRNVEDLLESRRKSENPAQLLSAESLSRLFPEGAGVLPLPRLAEPLATFDTAVRAGLLGDTFGPVVEALLVEVRGREVDVPALTRDLETLNATLRLTEARDRPLLLVALESVWQAVPYQPPKAAAGGHFEYALLRLQLATSRACLGDEVQAAAGLAEVLEWYGAQTPSRIDCEDVCGKALDTASTLPVARRAPVLEAAAEALTGCLLTQRPSPLDELHLLKCLDQAAETAGSRERLVAGRLRTWLLQDELQIRRRMARPLGGQPR